MLCACAGFQPRAAGVHSGGVHPAAHQQCVTEAQAQEEQQWPRRAGGGCKQASQCGVVAGHRRDGVIERKKHQLSCQPEE